MRYIREVISSRELLANLTLREIRGKYKRTVLGQLWSLANPLAAMLVYTAVFSFILRIQPDVGNPSGLNVFALWLLCGLLPWTFLANVINGGMSSLIDNAGLVQKVYFTRIVLPLSQVGSIGFSWLSEMGVLAVALTVFGANVLPWLLGVIIMMAILAVFGAGLALMLSVANVHFRDTQYFVSIILQIWMYLTPIIYPLSLVADTSKLHGGLFGTNITVLNIYELNPMEHFVAVFRQLLYDNRWPDPGDFLICVVCAFVSFAIGLWIFRRSERGLAEAL